MLWRLVKRMVRPIWQPVIDSTIYHTRVELKVQRVEGGEKTPAPRYPSEQKPFEEAQRNEGARKDLEAKHAKLAGNLDQITIRSIDPAPLPASSSDRPLPTHSSDIQMIPGGDAGHEYGYYEPPPEKLAPGKLTLREALEILRLRTGIESAAEKEEVEEKTLQAARGQLEAHPATRRVSAESLELIWNYYRPFDAKRKRKQTVIRKQDLDDLIEQIEDYPSKKLIPLSTIGDAWREKMAKRRIASDKKDAEEEAEALNENDQLTDALRQIQEERMQKLAKRLEDLKALDAETKAEQEAKEEEEASAGSATKTAAKGGAT